MIKDFNPVRGTLEYLPSEMSIREKTKQIILDSYRKNGFLLIKTPILENLDFLNNSDGGDNLRLMFKTIKRGAKLNLSKPDLTEEDITEEGLRYDLTVPLIRFYCNNKEKLPIPFKAIQIGDSFRAERPQRGRSREFMQCDIDILGDATINAEIDIICTVLETYKKIGFDNITFKINDRRILNQLITFAGFNSSDINTVLISLDKLDKIGVDGIQKELLEKGYSQKKAGLLLDAVTAVQTKGFLELKRFGVEKSLIDNISLLSDSLNKNLPNGYSVKYDISIVRGQGYYTGTVFEAYTEGFQRAIGGGGRYDTIMEKLAGISTPMVGFSIGFEPCCMLIQERGIKLDDAKTLVLIYSNEDSFSEVLSCKKELMKEYNVSIYVKPKNLKNLLLKLKDSGFTHFVLFNKNAKKQTITILE